MAISVGDLLVTIGLDTKNLTDGVTKTESALGNLNSAINKTILSVAAMAAGAAAAGAAYVEHLVNKTIDVVKAQVNLAYQLGTTVQSLQVLAIAARSTGLSTDEFNSVLGRMQTRLAEAARKGVGPASDAIQRLGLNAKDLLALPVDERLIAIAKRFQDLGYSTAQQGEVLRQFGVRGLEMLNIFAQGGDKLKKAQQAVVDYGIALSDIDATTIANSTKAFKQAQGVVDGLGNQLTLRLAPIITDISNRFLEFAKQGKGIKDIFDYVESVAIRVMAALSQEIYDVTMNWNKFVSGLVDGVNYLSGLSNKFDAFFGQTKNAIPEIENTWKKALETLAKPPSAEDWKKYYDDRVKIEQDASAKIVAERNKTKGAGAEDLDALTAEQRKALDMKLLELKKSIGKEDEALQAQRDEELAKFDELVKKKIIKGQAANDLYLAIEASYLKKLDDLRFSKLEEGVAKEGEILARKYSKQLEDIQNFENNRTITEQAAANLRAKYAQKNMLDMLQLQSRQYSGLAGIVDTAMSSISQIVGQKGGVAFTILKGISMATALVKGYEAVVSAFAAGNAVGGPPVGFAFAAIAAAGVAAQIAALAAVQPSSTATSAAAPDAGSAGGSSGAPAPAAAGAGQTLYVQGIDRNSLFSGDAVRDLAGRLVQYQKDGGTVVIK